MIAAGLCLFPDNPAGRHYESADDTMADDDGVAEIISAEVQQNVHRLMTVITCRPRIMSLFQGLGRAPRPLRNYSRDTRQTGGVEENA